MISRIIIRTSAVAVILVAATADDSRPLTALEGCGYSCEELSQGNCFSWPSQQACEENLPDECEIYLAMFGPDCERACEVEDAYCSDEECAGSDVWQECVIGIREPH